MDMALDEDFTNEFMDKVMTYPLEMQSYELCQCFLNVGKVAPTALDCQFSQ